ncbi:MAG: hypothetical protein J1F43_04185 [Muribaculaceae bacterium]|nr:hypothetical protein [Muribaculaceae bacterium]
MKHYPIIFSLIFSLIFGAPIAGATTNDDESGLFALVHWDGMKTTNKGVAVLPTSANDWTGQLSYVWTTGKYPYNYGGVHIENKYFCVFLRIMDGYLLEQYAYIFDDKTGEQIDQIHLPIPFDLYDGDYYEADETIYAFVKDFSTEKFGWAKIDPTTARMEMVKEYPSLRLYGVAITEDGQAYGISGDGEVYSIDRTTGEAQLLFSHDDLATKTEPKAHTGGAWDEDNKRMVFAVCNLEKDGGSRLFSVDPAKKTVNLIYKLDGLGTQLAGLYFEQAVHPQAPGVATNLAVNFPNSSLSGKISFKLPTTHHDGSLMNKNMDYVVKIDGHNIHEGSGAPGQDISLDASLDKEGWHTFFVRCSNENGKGRSTKFETFVGYEAPLPPSNISARHYGGKMHINWTPSPDKGAKGGPVDVENIKYVIKTNQGETFLSEPGATSYEYTLPVPESFTPWYSTISAQNAEGTSAPVASNNVPLGVLTDDYFQDFSKESSKYDFTTLDSNNDGLSWYWSNEGLMAIRYNASLEMDDYLTLPPVNMNYGDFYALEFDAGVYNFEEKIEVTLGEDYNQTGMNNAQVVFGPVNLTATNFQEESWHHLNFAMKAPDDSKFFISIHGISPADRNVILIDNIYLRKLAGGGVPAAITDLVAIADSKGGKSVTIKGSLPKLDVAGNTLASVDYIKISRDGKLIATITPDNPVSFTWTDTGAIMGGNNYVVTAGNSIGDGMNARCAAYAGFVNPKTPEDCELEYAADSYSSVKFSWSPVTEDLNGKDIKDVVDYDVIKAADGVSSYLSKGQKEAFIIEDFSSLTYPIYVQYGTYANVNGLNGDMIVSPQIPVGPALKMPLIEGFNSGITMPYGLDLNLNNSDSGLYTTSDNENYQSADGDGGHGVFIGSQAGESATIYTAWIKIPENAVEPVASIQFFGEGDALNNMIYVGVSTNLAEDFRLAASIETGGMGWQTAEVDLSQYRGKDIRMALKFETQRNTYLRFDDFRVYDKGDAGVDGIFNEGSFTVIAGNGRLSIDGTNNAPVNIYALDGRKIHQGYGDVSINMNSGIYVVNVGKESLKVLVK